VRIGCLLFALGYTWYGVASRFAFLNRAILSCLQSSLSCLALLELLLLGDSRVIIVRLLSLLTLLSMLTTNIVGLDIILYSSSSIPLS
jgi:hypothetical protein